MIPLKDCKNPLEFLKVNFNFSKPVEILGIKTESKVTDSSRHKNKKKAASRRKRKENKR